jgi:thymidylate synthase (FAD)
MSTRLGVLDHGFVVLRNMAGPTRRALVANQPGPCERAFDADDTDVANAARLSFEGQDQARAYDVEMKLTRYLAQHWHMTPFEVIVVWLEMKLPIFVARQLVRQRTQSINEASARYIKLPAEWYIPEIVGGKPTGGAKQGQSDTLDDHTQRQFRQALELQCRQGYDQYTHFLDRGVAPEHARMFLHVNHYTHWLTTMNLRNLLVSFLLLRDDNHAQLEAQHYAQATIKLMEPHLPGLMTIYHEVFKATR